MLIGRELCSIRVKTMEMMLWWHTLFFSFLCVCDLLRTVNGNGHQTVNVILKNKLTTIFKVCTLIDDRNDVKKFKILW